MNLDFSVFTSPEAWISLFMLMFLEVVLGIDNLVFIAITTNRLPEEKRHIGRRLGLAAALLMRCTLLVFAAYLVSMTNDILVIESFEVHGEPFGLSLRDIVLIAGGIYLVFKGISEIRDMLDLVEEKAQFGHHEAEIRRMTLGQAVLTIMVMDMVFSLDSIFTAVGLSGQLVIMIPAVVIAVLIMMIFADPISEFINKHAEIKLLALTFITVIGVLLILEGLDFVTGMELLGMGIENLMVYFAMFFSLVLQFIQMRYRRNLAKMHAEIEEHRAACEWRAPDDVNAVVDQKEDDGNVSPATAPIR